MVVRQRFGVVLPYEPMPVGKCPTELIEGTVGVAAVEKGEGSAILLEHGVVTGGVHVHIVVGQDEVALQVQFPDGTQLYGAAVETGSMLLGDKLVVVVDHDSGVVLLQERREL